MEYYISIIKQKLKTELNLCHGPHFIALKKGTIFAKKCQLSARNADQSKM